MRWQLLTWSLLAGAAWGLAWPGPAPADEDPPAKFLSPKDDSQVEESEDVEGQIKEGWPVVLVRSLKRDQPYFVQAHVEDVKKGVFSVAVVIGDKMSERDSKFRLVILCVKSQADARKYKQGSTMPTLPAGIPRSEFITVRRK